MTSATDSPSGSMPAGGATRDDPIPRRLQQLISFASSFVAPITVLSTLLFYFGYASSRAQYRYFGLDVDSIGLSTQDFVMRSPQPLLVPLLLLGLLGALVVMIHTTVRRHLDGDDGWLTRTAGTLVLLGELALAVGVALLFAYSWIGSSGPYALGTALVLAVGAGLLAYGLNLQTLLGRRQRPHLAATASIYLILATSLFWATATVAQFSGTGFARSTALHLDDLPHVILDTKERLYLTSPGVVETALPPADGQAFRYRYRNLRLLIQGHDRLFLVPGGAWSASDSTIAVPISDAVRLQFQFTNDPP